MKDKLTEEAEVLVTSDDYIRETYPSSWYIIKLLKMIIRLLLDIRDKLDVIDSRSKTCP